MVPDVQSGKIILVPIVAPRVCHRSFVVRRSGVPVSPSSQLVESLLVSIGTEMIARYGLCARMEHPAALAARS